MGRGNAKRGRGRGGGRGGPRLQRGRGQKRRGDSNDRGGGRGGKRFRYRREESSSPEPSPEPPAAAPSSDSSDEEPDAYAELLGTMDLQRRPAVLSDDDEEGEEEEACEAADLAPEVSEEDDDDLDQIDDNEEVQEFTAAEEKECESALDPFYVHLSGELSPAMLEAVSTENPTMKVTRLYWPSLGHMQLHLPDVDMETAPENPKTKPLLAEEKIYLKPAKAPELPTGDVDWSALHVKQQIQRHLQFANSASSADGGGLTGLQREVFALLNNYQDVYLPERNAANAEQLRFVYCLHAVNHVLKTRSKILLHNSRLVNKGTEVPDEFRDQGLVRPKVLILLPFRDSAFRTINTIISILLGNEKGTVMNQKRYIEEFTGEQLHLPKKNPKPEDYENLFRGNTDDNFRIGMSVTKKRLKLYSDFYMSDIIVASPLGLRMIVGAEGDEKRDFDFLAGLELVVMDQAEVCFEQNWDHVLHLWEHLHLQPREAHSTDFSRLRFSALAGHARYLSQTCLLAGFQLPEFAALIRRRGHNFAGRVVVCNPIQIGSVSQVLLQLPQVFQRIDANSAAQCIEKRLEVFTNKILPQFKDSVMNHTVIFVPSYFDYVRLRNYFQKESIGFTQICEYTKEGKVAKARDLFFHNEAHFLLYSERFHFFRRIRLKGIRHLIFYQPPTFPNFYPELCNFMQDAYQNNKRGGGSSSNMTVTVLYSKYDAQRIAAIVGSDRAAKMISSEKSTYMVVTGSD